MQEEDRLVQIESEDWPAAFKFANALVRVGTPVSLVTRVLRERDNSLITGSLVTTSSQGAVEDHADRFGVRLREVGGQVRVQLRPLSDVIVGLYGGGGSPFNHASVLAACGFRMVFLSDAEIRAGALEGVDVLIMPGGGFQAMQGQLNPLGAVGAQAITEWVRRGGMYIGSCAGAFDCAIASDAFVRNCPAKGELQLVSARIWNEGSGELEGLHSPGVGTVFVENVAPEHPVMFGLPETFPIVHYNGPVFEPVDEQRIDGASLATPLARFTGAETAYTAAERFMGEDVTAPTVLERATAAGMSSVVAGELGLGRVVAFGSHPEFGFDLPMRAWGEPARMLANAVIWQASQGGYPLRLSGAPRSVSPESYPREGKFQAVEEAARSLAAVIERLQEQPIEPTPPWLSKDYAMSFFGENPASIWIRSLADMNDICGDIIDLAVKLRCNVISDEFDRLANAFILSRRDPSWQQDGGFEGALPLLEVATRRCEIALERWDAPLGPPKGAYSYVHENPYHLVAGSYLASVGCAAGAWHLLSALRDEASMLSSGVIERDMATMAAS